MTVILVKKRSTWEQYHANRDVFGEVESASLMRMKESHDRHTSNVHIVLEALQALKVRPWIVDGAEIAFATAPGDTVFTVGGDGTFLSASHNVGPNVGIMGINSDPVLSCGRFCHVLHAGSVKRALKKVLKKRPKVIQNPEDGRLHQRPRGCQQSSQ
jgi:NAD+ kinase